MAQEAFVFTLLGHVLCKKKCTMLFKLIVVKELYCQV